MDRASDSGSEGWGFESLPVYLRSRRLADGESHLLFWYTKVPEQFNAKTLGHLPGGGTTPAPLRPEPLQNGQQTKPAARLLIFVNYAIILQISVTFPVPMLSNRVKGPNRKEV